MTKNIELLKECDVAYFNGEDSPLTDIEYDKLKREEFNKNPSDPYFVTVGSLERTGKIRLPYVMGSLNQLYENESERWVSKYNTQESDIIISDKLDGTSIMIVYNDGKLSIAYSRGNGIEGADITRHVLDMDSIPKEISKDYSYLVVRGECIMKNSTFDQKYNSEYKNARNMVAGAMNRKETDKSILSDIDIIIYDIVDIRGKDNLTKKESLQLLNDLGFLVVKYYEAVGKDLSDSYLSSLLSNARVNSDYELDGIVISINDTSELQSLSTADTLNPEYSVKYKVLDENSIVEVYVADVLWEVSKNSFIKPRVEIIPVELMGTTVKYATGFNAKFIMDNGINKGAKIRITKAGSVIPYIIEVLDKVDPSVPPEHLGTWEWNETGVEAVLTDKNNSYALFKQTLDFFETYKIDQLKEANLRKVWNVLEPDDYDDAIIQICDLSRIEWYKIIGVNGERIYDSIQKRLGESLHETFLGACSHMGLGFGVRKARALLNSFTYDSLRNISIEDFDGVEGFGDKTARRTIEGIIKTLDLADSLIDNGVLNFVEIKKTSELSAVNVVMTGFRDAYLHSEIESKGGKVSSGVSKKTTHLLTLDPDSNSGKAKKARELGVMIMSPDDFKIEFNL